MVAGELRIGLSYREPVAITDGRDTLVTIDSWSVTTSGHVSTFRQNAPGRCYPATTDTMRRVARTGSIREFGAAIMLARLALDSATERKRLKGVPVERMEAGYCPKYSYRTEDCYIWRADAGRWYLRVNDAVVSDHDTLREARVAAWSALGITPKPSVWEVEASDFPACPV
jgi:hypothetical protein